MSKKRLLRSKIRRTSADFDYIDKLSPAEREWLERFQEEYYFNTIDPDPEKRLHKGDKPMRVEGGFGIYKAYNDAYRDPYSVAAATGLLESVDARASRDDESRSADELFPPANTSASALTMTEDDLIDLMDAERSVGTFDIDLGTSPKKLSVSIRGADGKKRTVYGTTLLQVRGIVVRDIYAKDGMPLWAEERTAAAAALHEKRKQFQDKLNTTKKK